METANETLMSYGLVMDDENTLPFKGRNLKLFFIILISLFLSACAPVPKVIVLNDPLSAEEHLSLGLSYEMTGEYDDALREYDKAITKGVEDYRPFYFMANAYYRKGEYDLAEDFYQKALEISPGNGDIYNNLAWTYMAIERLDEARVEIEKALGIRRDPYFLDTLANIYGRMGRYDDAVTAIQEAIGITGAEQVDLLFSEYRLLGDLYELMGKEDLAAESREKAESYRRKHP